MKERPRKSNVSGDAGDSHPSAFILPPYSLFISSMRLRRLSGRMSVQTSSM